MKSEKISPALIQIENALWEHELDLELEPNFSYEDLRAASKIFMSVFMANMWKLQEKENINMKIRENMAQKAGEELRKLIKTYTNIDSHDFYNH